MLVLIKLGFKIAKIKIQFINMRRVKLAFLKYIDENSKVFRSLKHIPIELVRLIEIRYRLRSCFNS